MFKYPSKQSKQMFVLIVGYYVSVYTYESSQLFTS